VLVIVIVVVIVIDRFCPQRSGQSVLIEKADLIGSGLS